MKAVRRGLENIRTMRSMVNNSMPMSSRGALMERARLNQERERLWNELDRLKRRMGVIGNRPRSTATSTSSWRPRPS